MNLDSKSIFAHSILLSKSLGIVLFVSAALCCCSNFFPVLLSFIKCAEQHDTFASLNNLIRIEICLKADLIFHGRSLLMPIPLLLLQTATTRFIRKRLNDKFSITIVQTKVFIRNKDRANHSGKIKI